MSVYFIVNAAVTDRATLDAYVAAARSTLGDTAVTRHVATNEAETVEGAPAGARVVVLEFPDRDAFRAWYHSPAYQAIIGTRLASTEGFAVLADGLAP